MSLRLLFHQSETVVVGAVIELAAAVIAGYGAPDRFDAVDGCEAVRAEVAVIALHAAAFEGQRVKRLLSWNAQIRAGDLPLRPMGVDVTTTAPLVSHKVGEFMFECAPEFFRWTFAEFRIEFDHSVRPPGAACGGLHPRVPCNPHLARKLRQIKVGRGFRAPRREAAVLSNRLFARWSRGLENPQPGGPSEFELRHSTAHWEKPYQHYSGMQQTTAGNVKNLSVAE